MKNFIELVQNELQKDTYTAEQKEAFYLTLMEQMKTLQNNFPLTTFTNETFDDGTEFFGFHLDETDIMVGFNFWEKNYTKLTVGLYSPHGTFKDLNRIFSRAGYLKNSHWIFQEFYPAYIWKNYEFDAIPSGHLKIILMKAISNVLQFATEKDLLPYKTIG